MHKIIPLISAIFAACIGQAVASTWVPIKSGSLTIFVPDPKITELNAPPFSNGSSVSINVGDTSSTQAFYYRSLDVDTGQYGAWQCSDSNSVASNNNQITLNNVSTGNTQYQVSACMTGNGCDISAYTQGSLACSDPQTSSVTEVLNTAGLRTANPSSDKNEYVGFTAGQFRVSETGAATYSVPINLPAGTAGVQPQVSLNYSSQGGDGLMGVGWSLAATSTISRCPKTFVHDGEIGGVNYTVNDRLCLDGQRLILNGRAEKTPVHDNDAIYENKTNAQYWSTTATYHTEIDSQQLIRPNYYNNVLVGFTVENKAGEIHYYGKTERQTNDGKSLLNKDLDYDFKLNDTEDKGEDAFHAVNTGSNVARHWSLKAIRDVKDNYILYKYVNDEANGEHYLASIHYTGNSTEGLSPYAKVEFQYHENKKPKSGWLAGYPWRLTKILDKVRVVLDGSKEYRTYNLSYIETDFQEEKNYLETISECVGTGCLKPLSFSWKKRPAVSTATHTYTYDYYNESETISVPVTDPFKPFSTNSSSLNSAANPGKAKIFDINGDGYADLVFVKDGKWKIKFGPSFGGSAETLVHGFTGKAEYALVFDYNGDGVLDLLVANNKDSNWHVVSYHMEPVEQTSTACFMFSSCVEFTTKLKALDTGVLAKGLEGNTQLLDIDGDALVDIVYASGQTLVYRRNNGDGTFEASKVIADFSSAPDQTVPGFFNERGITSTAGLKNAASFDVNGDGRSDLLFRLVEEKNQCSRGGAVVSTRGECEGDLQGEWTTSITHYWKIYVATGTDSLTELQTIKTFSFGSYGYTNDHFEPRIADLNGDGLSDITWVENGGWFYKLSDGTQLLATQRMKAINSYGSVFDVSAGDHDQDHALVVDVNSDGRTDILLPNSSGSAWTSYFSLPVKNNPDKIIFQSRGSYSFDKNSYRQLADLNGDGKIDYLKGSTGGSWSVFYGGAQGLQIENVLSSITNGFGVKTSLAYSNITNSSVYIAKDSPHRFDASGNEITNLFSPKSAFFVVSKATSDTNDSATNSVSYRYGGLLLHKKGRGLLGFETVRSIDDQTCLSEVVELDDQNGNTYNSYTSIFDCITTETHYAQQFPYTGMPLETIQTVGNTGRVLSYAKNTLAHKKTADGGFYPYIYTSLEESYASNDSLSATQKISVTESTFAYDSYGNLSSSIIKLKHPTSTSKYSITETTNVYGQSTLYKRLGRLTSTKVKKSFKNGSDPLVSNEVSSGFGYYNSNLMLKTSDNGKVSTEYTYDAFGNKEKIVVTGYADIASTNLQDRAEETIYDVKGRFVVKKTNSYGHVTQFTTYGETGTNDSLKGKITQIVTKTANNSVSTSYFDKFGNKTRDVVTGASNHDPSLETRYYQAYCSSVPNSNGCKNNNAYYRTIKVSSGSPETQVFFDAWGREISVRTQNFSGNWTVTQKTYDDNGRLKYAYEPSNVSSTATNDSYSTYYSSIDYDRIGRVIQKQSPRGLVNFSYGAESEYQTLTATDQDEIAKKEYTDWTGKTAKIENKHGTSVTGRLDYYYTLGLLLDSVKVHTDGSGNAFTQVKNYYDEYGRKIVTNDNSKGEWSYKYNDFDELVEQTNSSSQVTTFSYDKLGRKLSRLDNDGFTEWTYDDPQKLYSLGKLTQVALFKNKTSATGSPDYSESYRFTSNGQTAAILYLIDGESFESEYFYDNYNRLRYTRYPANNFTVKHTYTPLGFASQVINATTGHRDEGTVYTEVAAMNARGQATSVTLGNGITETRDFDDDTGWLKYIGIAKGTSNALHSLNYSYYDNGNLETRANTFSVTSAAQNTNETFYYDNLNRLRQRKLTSNSVSTTQDYVYDRLGNIKTKDGLTYNYTNKWGKTQIDTITGSKNYTFKYDDRGNVTSDGTRTFTYSSFDLPTKITKGTTSVNFSYGAARQLYRRTQSDSGGVTDTLTFGGYERTSLPSGVIEHKYMVGNTVVTDRSNNVNDTLYLHKDSQGSTISITNSSGNVQQHFAYDPWGKQNAFYDTDYFAAYSSPAESNGYTGHKMLNDIGIIHMNGRIYDPTLGRFLQADPHIQAPENSQNFNRYSYVLNNPLSYTDPSGYFFKKLGKFIKKHWRTIASIAIAVYLPGAGGFWNAIGVSASNTVAVGAITGFISGGVATGSLRGALVGAFTGGMFGKLHSMAGGFGKVVAHGTVGGLGSVLNGGKFGHGFLSAGFTQAAGNIKGMFVEGARTLGDRLSNAVKAAVIGGTASAITGGKFASGAITGAFSRLLNDDAFDFKSLDDKKLLELSDPKLEISLEAGGNKLIGLDSNGEVNGPEVALGRVTVNTSDIADVDIANMGPVALKLNKDGLVAGAKVCTHGTSGACGALSVNVDSEVARTVVHNVNVATTPQMSTLGRIRLWWRENMGVPSSAVKGN